MHKKIDCRLNIVEFLNSHKYGLPLLNKLFFPNSYAEANGHMRLAQIKPDSTIRTYSLPF